MDMILSDNKIKGNSSSGKNIYLIFLLFYLIRRKK